MSGVGGVQLDGMKAAQPAAVLQRRRTAQREVAQLYARRFMRTPLVPQGGPGVGPVQTDNFEKVVLQKDFLNVVGGVDSQSNGLIEVEVTRDTDGGMRFYADVDVHLTCKNTSGVTLTKGTPVYVTGSVGATTTVEIAAADAGNAAKMPAIGLLEQDLAPNEFGRTIAVGVLPGLNTLGYSINQTAFVAVGGGLTGTRPTAATALVQNIGRVLRVNGSNGEILVLGAGRTNDVPNYTAGRLIGRGTASAGPAQEITVGSLLSLSGTTLSATQQDAFRAISVAGQNTIYASGPDGFELIAGTNITLTTDDTLKTVTIDAAAGSGVADADYGDVTVSSSGSVWTVDNNAITYAKIQDVSATDRILGRSSAGAGDIQEITCTSAGRALLDDADNAAQRTTLGLATIASSASASDLTTGTVPTARLGTGTANSTTFLRGDQTWATPAGGSSPVKFADAPINAVAVNSTTLVDLVSKTVTVTAGDTIEIELTGTILNNSGGTRTYTYEAELGAFGLTCLDGTTVAASATNRSQINIRAVFAVQASNNAAGTIVSQRAAPAAADVAGSIATTTYRHTWNTTTSNLTGSQAVKLRILSSAATATQTFTVFTYRVTQHPQAL